MTEQEQQELWEFYQRLKGSYSVDFVELLKMHRHNKHDFPPIQLSETEGLLGMDRGGTGVALVDPGADRLLFWDDSAGEFKFLTLGTGLNISDTTINGTDDPTLLTVNAGETLSEGEVVSFYTAVGNQAADGYQMVNGTLYAIRAAADNTTYGNVITGVVHEAMSYLGTGRIRVAGVKDLNGVSTLTKGSVHYLANYGASTETISQTTGGSDQSLAPVGFTIVQTFKPTSSRLVSVKLRAKSGPGTPQDITLVLKRSNSVLGTVLQTVSSTTYVDLTYTFNVRVYKGETLTLNIDSANGLNASLEYASGSNPYADGSASGGSIPASSDICFKVNENIGFGTVGTSAGTRKIKIGPALSSDEIALHIQYGDSIL